MTTTSIMTEEEDDPSVHLHQEVDAEFQNDDCITTKNRIIMGQLNTNQQQKRLSLIRLESGRQIWWLDNGIPSHRAEIMLRRRMRYLQEEQEQQQAELMENYGNNISTESGDDVKSQSNYEQGSQHNNLISAISDSHNTTPTKEPIITEAVQPSKDTDNALPMEQNTNFASQQVTNNSNTINAVRQVSLESIDEPTLHTYQHQSNQQLMQHCHENNIPVITVGTIPPSRKKIWLDFGEDNVNTVGEISTRQFLIYASTESATLDADSSVINVTLECMSSKGGFTCMLHNDASTTKCTGGHQQSCDPIELQLKQGESQMMHVVWNPIQEGCVRENMELRINTGEGQVVVMHEIVLVGSARERDSTTHAIESSNAIIEKEEWNGVSVEWSEIKEDGSKHELNMDGVGLAVTEESIDCSSIGTNGEVSNGLIHSHEVDELTHMMKNASISPKKASMAAKSLSQLPEPRNEDGDETSNRSSPNRRVNAKQIMAVQEEIKSGRVFAEESRLISQTSQDFVNDLYMNDKVRHLLNDFDAESISTDDRRSGRSTPTFGSLSSEEEKSIPSDISQRLHDEQQFEPEAEAVEEDEAAEKTEAGGASSVTSLDRKQQSSERLNTSTSDHYDKVTTELNALMEDVSNDLLPSDDQLIEPEVEAAKEDEAAENIEANGARAVASLDEMQQSSEIFDTSTSDHYDKVTGELNALMDNVSDDLQSQSAEEENCSLSDISQRLCDDQQIEPEVAATEEDLAAEKTETGGISALQQLRDKLQVKPELEVAEEDMAVEKTETGGAGVLASQDENQLNSERLNTTTSDHYDKVAAELNALMEDVTDDLQSQSESDYDSDSYLSSEESYVSDDSLSQSESESESDSYSSSGESESDSDSYFSSGESDQSRDDKIGIFNFDESMSNEENEELNMLPETSILSSDRGSSGVDTSIDSDQLRNPYRQMSSEMGALMDEFSELEKFAQMQQNYLTSPTTHNFQTQLENINEQIDNFTPSPANMGWKNVERNTSENRPGLRVKETKELKKPSKPPTAKAAAKRCYFYKSPRKEKSKPLGKASPAPPSGKVSTLSTPNSSDAMEEKRVPYKSPFAAVCEAETRTQSTDSMMGSFSSFNRSDCASRPESEGTTSSDGILADSPSLDESFSSGESEFGESSNTSADLNDDTSVSFETSSSISLQNKEMKGVESESLRETRSEQIVSLKSKLSSWKADSNDQQTPSPSGTQRHSSPAKIPQQRTSSTRKVHFKNSSAKSLDLLPLKTPASSSQMSKERQHSSPSEIPQLTSSSRKLQLNTPAQKTFDVASSTVSKTFTAQQSARMAYGNFSQPSTTERVSSESEVAETSRLPPKKAFLKTPPPRCATSRLLKTPSSRSAYEKHIERMKMSRARDSFS